MSLANCIGVLLSLHGGDVVSARREPPRQRESRSGRGSTTTQSCSRVFRRRPLLKLHGARPFRCRRRRSAALRRYDDDVAAFFSASLLFRDLMRSTTFFFLPLTDGTLGAPSWDSFAQAEFQAQEIRLKCRHHVLHKKAATNHFFFVFFFSEIVYIIIASQLVEIVYVTYLLLL